MNLQTPAKDEPGAPQPRPGRAANPAEPGVGDLLPYVAPMFAFLALTSLEAYLPEGWYPLAYAAKVAIVSMVAIYFRAAWSDLRPLPRIGAVTLAVVVGLIVYVLWVRLDGLYPPLSFLGKRTGFDPTAIPSGGRQAFIAVRLFGLVLLVPLIEELFWRSFLMRWIINPNFLEVPVGRVTPAAAGITSAAFALAHPEWLPAILTGLLWAGLLWRTRSLFACFVSHLVANLALGIHVLSTGEWRYW
ncbi:CAAX amino terminal protease self- immunity [Aquisphaera giovannonii]|uniref:CAAX amino terminal protease self-immunity n=1 Tax=Aquisphaera giovannonii TaxID=406548 RepID=A0A5B9W018_9BACT|nr:CAAX prenyl protease-related protein [Aquisphaera giovannonii]QEH33611.1 CAAX amino terminal protease self- immunity [Aquisphaera giovannonii]